jgi:EcsC protein family
VPNDDKVAVVMNSEDRDALERAVRTLETPGFVARLANWVGIPVEQIVKRLPGSASEIVNRAVSGALKQCLHVALYKLESDWSWFRSESTMKAIVAATGAAGGAFGLGALTIELPVTTSVMLRSIAEIARGEGEDVRSPEGRVACLEVLAIGSGSAADDVSKTSYFVLRAALAREVTDALGHLAAQTASRDTAPVLVRLLEAIAARFGVVVSEKAAAGAVPVIGAIGSATVNALFMDHFQDVAHGHFTVRRLERKYGADLVRTEYDRHLESMRRP